MKVSIVLLTFNRKQLLKRAIEGILSQTFRDFELIIVDNCSIDGTEDFVKSLQDLRIKYFKNQNNGIIAVNMNFGILKSQGEYIALCDDDDYWLPFKLEKQLEILSVQKNVALVCTNWIEFTDDGDVGPGLTKKRASSYVTQREILIRNCISQSTVLFRKNVVESLALFDESPEYFTAEEFEMWLKILKSHQVYLIEEPLVREKTHPGVFRSKGIRHLNICKRIVDDLWKKGYISLSNHLMFMCRYCVYYTANMTGLNKIYHKVLHKN